MTTNRTNCFAALTNRAGGVAIFALFCLASVANASAGQAGPLVRSIEVKPVGSGKPGFTLMNVAVTGVGFTNILQGDAWATNAVAHNGSGVAIGDVDGDGWPDIYLCKLQGPNRLYRNLGQWRFEEVAPGEAACPEQFSTGAAFADVDGDGDLDLLVNGISAGTRLFLNDGKGRWSEVKESGLSRTASATSMALGDIDGDGDLDLYCAHYIDVMHMIDPTTRFSLIKRDGRWSVLKVNDLPTTLPGLKDRFEALPDGKVRELPEVHGLYRNDGQGRFTAIQSQPGVFLDEAGKPIPPFRDWGLAAMFRDINGDGAPDLYVCNDNVSPDRIWINSGNGTFRSIDPFAVRHTSRSSMGVDFGDIDRDGLDDIIVVDMLARDHGKRMTQLVKDLPDPNESERVEARPQYNRNTLFFGRPDGSYVEAALFAGVAASDWSWSPILIDVDLDGYEDLLVSNGFEFDVMDQDTQNDLRDPRRRRTRDELKRVLTFYPRWRTANAAFRNRRDGTFEPISAEWGFDHTGISFGMAVGDLDNDGDFDVVVNNLNEVASLYRNDAVGGRVAVRLHGLAPNTQAIGARVRLVGDSITQSQEIVCGGRYLSGDQPMRVFATTASAGAPMRLEVKWRSGQQSIITNVQPNRIIELTQPGSTSPGAPPRHTNSAEPFFADRSSMLGHVHVDESLDDWAHQPALPRRLSRLGPGVSWFDVDADGWEDLIVTSGKGGKLAVFRNEKGQGFSPLDSGPHAAVDQTTALGWSGAAGNRKLLVAVSNYEKPEQESHLAVVTLENSSTLQSLNRSTVTNLSVGKASIGPMALSDIDGDGDLDLFVGGRLHPGRYPAPVSSSVWVNDNDQLTFSPAASKPFESLGLVSGATFSDLNGDGRPDLALALEWGPVKVFINTNGALTAWDPPVRSLNSPRSTLHSLTGWWTGIATGDFDGDGRFDLAVGNWGRNTIYELGRDATPSSPAPPDQASPALGSLDLAVFYGDWNSDGTISLIEAFRRFNGSTVQRSNHLANWFPVQNRLWFDRVLPQMAAKFATHKAFSEASMQNLLEGITNVNMLSVTEFQSGVLLNRGSHFDWVPLPREAQLAPVLSINVGDLDSDGSEDLFLSQNFYGTSELTRNDNGRGLWLRGTGRGTFTAMDATSTGIKIHGEQRGAALADFNHDGRLDLCVTQNSGPTKLYVSRHAKRGLRVTLRGPPANPDAIGAQMRLVGSATGPGRAKDSVRGPMRIVTAGTGYWSQDAATQILGFDSPPISLWIRWPGGKEETTPIEKDVWDIRRVLP